MAKAPERQISDSLRQARMTEISMRRLLLPWVLTATMLSGCATAPATRLSRPDPMPFLRNMVLCQTTGTQIRDALGAPTRDGLLHDAHVMSWILGNDDGVVRYLAVLLDADGVVVDRIWNVPTEIPWIPADQCHRGPASR